MTDVPTYAATFVARPGESAADLGERLRAAAAELADRHASGRVVVLVADGHPDIPSGSFVDAMAAPDFAGMIVVSGAPIDELGQARAIYRVRRHVVVPSADHVGSTREPGVTLLLGISRASSLSADEFAAYWADHHAQVHLRCSPTTVRYEQLVVLEVLTEGASAFDGIGVLGYASDDLLHHMFADADAEAELFADVATLVDQPSVRALAVSEYVVRR
jgi:hypothetical protein